MGHEGTINGSQILDVLVTCATGEAPDSASEPFHLLLFLTADGKHYDFESDRGFEETQVGRRHRTEPAHQVEGSR